MTREELSNEARERVAGGAVLVDVRTAEEFAGGHVPGARNIPLQELPRRLGEVGPPGTRVVVYCQAGGRSSQAAQLLARSGYPDVFNLLSVNNW